MTTSVHETHERFLTAQALQAEITRLVKHRRDVIIADYVGRYRLGNLEPIQALAGFAALSELSSMQGIVDTEYKQSLKALERTQSARNTA